MVYKVQYNKLRKMLSTNIYVQFKTENSVKTSQNVKVYFPYQKSLDVPSQDKDIH